MNGPEWTYVAPFEKKCNGCGVVKALNSHCEGDAVMLEMKAAAFGVTTHTGERRNYGIAKYTNTLSMAFQTLNKYRETLAESRKVDVFLRSNHCMDPEMLLGIAVNQGNADRMSKFVLDKEKDEVQAKRAAAKASCNKNKHLAVAVICSSEKPDKGGKDDVTIYTKATCPWDKRHLALSMEM
ncbi:predicted protein [Phaeodactylum tricornutum CCAP 1055/1]|jgi:hypothetical protein|uniref:Uncharacterized protein n=2 Tax=Phaeodactylum tricornutum TaxID=2850 RepID=B7G214_PHATC|nr:predicted protein [Phaeodactylum tricornutum CCAP 1055/1]EEC47219.1 predicted protein [Phaeodactylum tricornutum CCAP 1055/1]|eukprot:XP_002181296.1 predicted protein [Phaeodactylum tricornutum CCAP 1055/1]